MLTGRKIRVLANWISCNRKMSELQEWDLLITNLEHRISECCKSDSGG